MDGLKIPFGLFTGISCFLSASTLNLADWRTGRHTKLISDVFDFDSTFFSSFASKNVHRVAAAFDAKTVCWFSRHFHKSIPSGYFDYLWYNWFFLKSERFVNLFCIFLNLPFPLSDQHPLSIVRYDCVSYCALVYQLICTCVSQCVFVCSRRDISNLCTLPGH